MDRNTFEKAKSLMAEQAAFEALRAACGAIVSKRNSLGKSIDDIRIKVTIQLADSTYNFMLPWEGAVEIVNTVIRNYADTELATINLDFAAL